MYNIHINTCVNKLKKKYLYTHIDKIIKYPVAKVRVFKTTRGHFVRNGVTTDKETGEGGGVVTMGDNEFCCYRQANNR